MGRAYLKTIDSLTKASLKKFVGDHVAKGSRVATDSLKSYSFLNNDYDHTTVTKKIYGKKSDMLPKVHLVVANLKTWLTGTYNCLPAKHLQKYLDEFTFRFNRRWKLENIFDKLLVRCVHTNTITYAYLRG